MKKFNQTIVKYLLILLFLSSMHGVIAQVKIGENTETISPYALLELEGTNKGFILPRLTSAERDAAFPQDTPVGTMIFNTDENVVQYFMEEIDPSSKQRTGLRVWENASDESPIMAETLPETGELGQLFFNQQNNMLYYYTSNGWVVLSSGGVVGNLPADIVFLGDTLSYVSNGVTSTLDLTHLASLASPTLTLTETRLGISNGNTVDLREAIDARIAASGLSTNSTSEVVTATGPAGPAGAPGAPGAAGQDGAGFLVAAGAPSTAVNSPTFYVNSTNGDQYYNPGGGSTWTLLPNSDNQNLTASALSGNNTMTLAISNGNTITLDFSSITGGTGTDSQTLTASALSANNTMTLAISNGNTITLDFSTLNAASSTDSQTLRFGSATTTQTTLDITDGNSLTLQASGSLSFNQTGTDTLELVVTQTDATLLIDADGNTQVQVEEGSNDDTIRFDTAGLERMVITPTGNVGIGKTTGLSAPLSVNVSSTVTEARLLDLISNDSRNLSLLQPNTAIGSDPFTWATPNAIQWRIDTTDAMIIDASGNVGIGTTSPVQNLTVDGSARITEGLFDSFNQAGKLGQVLSSTATGTNWIDTYAPNSGTQTNTTLRWDGTTWVENQGLVSDGSKVTSITTDLMLAANTTTSGTLTANATTTLGGALVDSRGNAGSGGQVLSSTGSQTSWISIAGTVTATSSNYTAHVDDDTILVLPAAAVTITLPTISGTDNGKKLTIKRGNVYAGTSDTLAIVPSSGTIDGAANLQLNLSYQGYTLQAFAGNWYITQRF